MLYVILVLRRCTRLHFESGDDVRNVVIVTSPPSCAASDRIMLVPNEVLAFKLGAKLFRIFICHAIPSLSLDIARHDLRF